MYANLLAELAKTKNINYQSNIARQDSDQGLDEIRESLMELVSEARSAIASLKAQQDRLEHEVQVMLQGHPRFSYLPPSHLKP
jgi:hypothetical protein